MSVSWKVATVAAIVAVTPLVASGSAEAATNKCASFPKSFSKVVYLPAKAGSLHKATKAHPGGWVHGQYAKFITSEDDDGYYAAYGKKHTVYLAKSPVICLWHVGDQGLAYKQGTRKQLAKAIEKPKTYPTYGLIIKKGKITRIVQFWHP
jgi:hypothetical protein